MMSYPFAKYGGKAAPGQSDPFAKYGGSSATVTASPAKERETIIDEQHPDLSLWDRFVVQNFSRNPKVSLDYLKKKYKDHDVRLNDVTGEINMKKKSEKDWRVIDSSEREWADILDLGNEVVQGGLVTGAGLMGAAAGGAAGSVVPVAGTLAGGMAGGAAGAGAAEYALESARQGLGSWLGLEGNYDPDSVANSAKWSAAFGALPAVGKSAWSVGKGFIKPWAREVGKIGASSKARAAAASLAKAEEKAAKEVLRQEMLNTSMNPQVSAQVAEDLGRAQVLQKARELAKLKGLE